MVSRRNGWDETGFMQTWEATNKIALRNEGFLVGGFFVFCKNFPQKIEIYYKAAGIINIYSDDCIAEDGRKDRWQKSKTA